MRLSTQDKIEILKAAVKADDLDALKQWVVGLVDASDALPDGKYDAPVPSFSALPSSPLAAPQVAQDETARYDSAPPFFANGARA